MFGPVGKSIFIINSHKEKKRRKRNEKGKQGERNRRERDGGLS